MPTGHDVVSALVGRAHRPGVLAHGTRLVAAPGGTSAVRAGAPRRGSHASAPLASARKVLTTTTREHVDRERRGLMLAGTPRLGRLC